MAETLGTSMKDDCQTPGYALEPLFEARDYKSQWPLSVWEPAVGEGLLYKALNENEFSVLCSDLKTGDDFLTSTIGVECDAVITNPPFSLKVEFMKRCLELDMPFALLMDTSAVSLKSFIEVVCPLKPEIGIVWFSPRVNFKMPFKGWGGSSPFATAWFTWRMGFSGNKYIRINHWTKEYRAMFEL